MSIMAKIKQQQKIRTEPRRYYQKRCVLTLINICIKTCLSTCILTCVLTLKQCVIKTCVLTYV